MWVNLHTNASYNFAAPEIPEHEGKIIEVIFPVIDTPSVDVSGASADVGVKANTLIDLGEISGNKTLNVTAADNLKKGGRVTVIFASDATARTVTFAEVAIVGVASKKTVQEFIFDGTDFVPVAAALSI
ncbi:MAG: hypothetical protein LBK03_04520 [Bacteroidales bacterium]|nr:hypothetical protein [Bacteroidales bacterium]